MAITKPPISPPFASDPTTQADSDLFDAPSFMVQGYTAPGGNPEIPLLGHHNWLFWWAMQSGRYHQSLGLPEWDATEDQYQTGKSVVLSSGKHYMLIGTATLALAPESDPTNWMPFGAAGLPEFGDGSVGDATITTSVAVNNDRYYNNLTINAGGILHVDTPFLLRVRGLLWIKSGGILRFGHPTELNGGNASASTGGAAGLGSNRVNQGTVGGGSNGGAGGQDGVSYAGNDGEALGPYRLGGIGGAGGAEGGGSGTVGGASGTSGFFDLASNEVFMAILAGGKGFARLATTTPKSGAAYMIMGGAGGGGGAGPGHLAPPASSTAAGGGGGAGGGVGIVCAQRVVAEDDGAFFAPGGNGGNGFGSGVGGGGGGGGGGYIGVVCGSFTGTTQTAAACCPGGAVGTGASSVAPTAGANGLIHVKTI